MMHIFNVHQIVAAAMLLCRILLAPPTVFAHTMPYSTARFDYLTENEFIVTLTLDFDDARTWSKEQQQQHPTRKWTDEQVAVAYVNAQISISADDAPIRFTSKTLAVREDDNGTLADAKLQGQIAPGTRVLQWKTTTEFGNTRVVRRIQGKESGQLILAGESATISVPQSQHHAQEPNPTPPPIFWQYVKLGVLHILPKGLDHIAFILGLFLLSPRLRPLITQLSLFTLAHSITLALTMLAVLTPPPWLVEPLIALSIVYVGIENLVRSEIRTTRSAVVFVFGLIHGMGFAGVLAEIGLPSTHFVSTLLAFNLGVELGQLLVVLLAFGCFAWWLKREWYPKRISRPLSVVVASMGIFWLVQRIAQNGLFL